MSSKNTVHRFGFITIAGMPNVGKSTLLNRIIGEKIAIISRKPQTTRHRILGIKTDQNAQLVFMDTPGIHNDHKRGLNRTINKTAINALSDIDLVLFMIDHRGWSEDSQYAFNIVKSRDLPVVLLINKTDRLTNKAELLPIIDESQSYYPFKAIIPVCAKHLEVDQFIHQIAPYIPEDEPGFPAEQFTDKSERFLASELIREQLIRQLGHELPYETAIEITRFADEENLLTIECTIWVERSGQKPIVIGHKGQRLKSIGKAARLSLERFFQTKVFLETWVKVRKGWGDNARLLDALGYREND